jgi:hypothetical protein
MEREETVIPSNLPDTYLMTSVKRIVHFMESRDASILSDVFALENTTLLDSFAPYFFQGSDAKDRWAKGFVEHAKNLTNLRHTLGTAQEYSHQGQMAFFSIPVIWNGETNGNSFQETGALALLFVLEDSQWRVQHYSWAATSFAIK